MKGLSVLRREFTDENISLERDVVWRFIMMVGVGDHELIKIRFGAVDFIF